MVSRVFLNVMAEALRLIGQGGVETRGRKPKDFDPGEKLPAGAIPWKVYDQAFRKLLPRGISRRRVNGSINQSDVLQPMREQLARERVATRARNNATKCNNPYPHLAKGAAKIHARRILFLAEVAQCIAELRRNGIRVSTKSVIRALSIKGIQAGTTTTQRAIREIRLGLPHR